MGDMISARQFFGMALAIGGMILYGMSSLK
jgi:hypothetical protein